MRKNEKGSSLIFALAVIMIITMVIAACMAISYSYYNRSIVANSERQAYLTAKSVLTNIVDNITAKDVDYLSLIPEVGESETYSVDDKFPSSEIGSVDSIDISRNLEEKDDEGNVKDNVTISVTVTYGKTNKTINADIKQYKDENNNWQVSQYYEGEKTKVLSPNMQNKDKITEYTDGIYSLVEDYGTMNTTEKKQAANEIINGKYKDIYENAVRKAKEVGVTFVIKDSNISNDSLRRLLFYGVYDGSWPTYNFEYANINHTSTYYIQAYFVSSSYTKKLIYASPVNQSTGSWNSINIVFKDGHWYYNPGKSIPVYGLPGKTKEEEDKNWNDKVETWFNDGKTIMIE